MQRFPKSDYALPEVALRECISKGHRPLTGAEFILERAVHNERGSPAWQVYPHTDILIGYGLFKEKPTLLVMHGGEENPFNTPEGYEQLRMNDLERNKFILNDNGLWTRTCEAGLKQNGNERPIWVIQGEALEQLFSGVVSISEAAEKTALVPMLGGTANVEGYLIGHRNNIGDRIGVLVDKDATNSVEPLVCPAVFGLNYISLNGGNYDIGCVVGVPVGAEGATPKKSEPKEGSFLSLLLGHQ